MKTFLATVVGVLLLGASAGALGIEQIIYYHNDIFGSPVAATDSSGNVLWKETYAPYGDRTKNQDQGSNEIWFHTKPSDVESGLSYFGARYYDPAAGRFMGADAASFDESSIHSFNKYAYGNNNPFSYRDLDGREPVQLNEMAIEARGPGGKFEAASARNTYYDLKNNREPLTGSTENRNVESANGGTKYSPINPGPLAEDVAKTFRSSTYVERTLSSEETVYRVTSASGDPLRSYWTSSKP